MIRIKESISELKGYTSYPGLSIYVGQACSYVGFSCVNYSKDTLVVHIKTRLPVRVYYCYEVYKNLKSMVVRSSHGFYVPENYIEVIEPPKATIEL